MQYVKTLEDTDMKTRKERIISKICSKYSETKQDGPKLLNFQKIPRMLDAIRAFHFVNVIFIGTLIFLLFFFSIEYLTIT